MLVEVEEEQLVVDHQFHCLQESELWLGLNSVLMLSNDDKDQHDAKLKI